MTNPMTVEELNTDIEVIISKCHGDEISEETASKLIRQTFIQFCEENNIYQVVEGELPAEENNMGNMNATQAEEFFNIVKEELGLADFGFGITTAGSICLGNKILIDKKDLHYPWFTKQIILHEIAHHIVPEARTHGSQFHRKYAELVDRFLAGHKKSLKPVSEVLK